ncbi:MAG: SBBP repeat-containing protein, partial [Bryobacteraceae bacterium]
MARTNGLTAYFRRDSVTIKVGAETVQIQPVGATLPAQPESDGLLPGETNFLVGRDPSRWKSGIPHYSRIVYRAIYRGIDMIYGSGERSLKTEFLVSPGSDPGCIQLRYSGVKSIRVDHDGSLVFDTGSFELREKAPELYQMIDGMRVPVEGHFRLTNAVTVGFAVGGYDRTAPLIIDPLLSYSTYLGGSGSDKAYGIAVDGNRNAYLAGYTDSYDFPVTPSATQANSGGGVDAFVLKLDPAGTSIVYSTFLGGSGDDRAFSIAVDAAGSAYVTGWTGSGNFPIVSAAQSILAGGRDAFVAKLNPAGTSLVYSTYLGGSSNDSGNGIAVDGSGNAYITGSASSTDFPVLGPQQAANRGLQDAFLTKLNTSGSSLVFSTYLGGNGDDRGAAVAVDSSANAYVTGTTSSTNFPTASPYQAALAAGQDVFVAKWNAAGTALVYSTYLGGNGTDYVEVGNSIAVDSAGSAYITGTTASTNFPTLQPLQSTHGGGTNDAFVTKFTPAGTGLTYSTYIGGASLDYGNAIAVDGNGYAHVAGYTSSVNFPALGSEQPAIGGSYDAYALRLGPAGNVLMESALLGGAGSDAANGIALDSTGYVYLAGQSLSSNFPLKTPIQSSNGGNLAAFAARLYFWTADPPASTSVSPSSGSGPSQTFTFLFSHAHAATDIAWVEVDVQATLSLAGACYLHYDRAANAVQLSNDAGSGWVGTATLGSGGTLQNNQCVVDAGASTASASGTTLTLALALAFKPVFSGTRNVYMRGANASGITGSWAAKGTWNNPPTLAPTNVSVTPASGSGSSRNFAFAFSDSAGYADIGTAQVHLQSTLVFSNACLVQYTRASNTLQLTADSGSGTVGSAVVGTANTLTNSQCSVDVAGSSVSVSGNNLTLNLSLVFKVGFAGAKTVSMNVTNNAATSSGWQAMGTWTATAGGSLPPANVSVTPGSGSGSTQAFSFAFSDPYGFTDINWVQVHFQTQLIAASACFIQYTRATNVVQLVADSGSGYAGSAILGSSTIIKNSQCQLDAAASSTSGAGDTFTLVLALTFKASFAG